MLQGWIFNTTQMLKININYLGFLQNKMYINALIESVSNENY